MEEITFSVMRNTQETETVLRQVLDRFERQHNIRVNMQVLLWENARQEVKQFAIRQRGPDVSVMATTWVADLIAMNALLPLSDRMAGVPLGRREDYIDAAWDTTHGEKDDVPFAAPWLVDTFVIHYRSDLLAKAGIDPSTAFSSLAALDETVRRLGQSGVPIPIQLPFTYDRFCTMHTLAAWVWGHGGEFCTPDGNQVLFHQPQALEGIRQFFQLARHLSAGAREQLLGANSANLFRQGQAGMAFGTLSFMHTPETIQPAVREVWAAAPLPGPHFVGGVNLVAWKYSRRERAVMELIRYLNQPEVVLQCGQAMLTSPARLAVISGPEYVKDPILNVISQSARSGRCYPPVPLWGLIEDRFTEALSVIGSSVLGAAADDGTTQAGTDALITQAVQGTARRLNITLESR
jgi:multiple sugar transport system substrate-binding protein